MSEEINVKVSVLLKVRFSKKPTAAHLAWVKANGFRFDRLMGCWFAEYSSEAEMATKAALMGVIA